LIPDLLVCQSKVVTAREADVQKIVGVWMEVVDFIKKNEDEAVKIMAKVVEQKPEDYKAFLPGTKFFDLKANLRAFTKDDDVHSLSGSGKVIQDFLLATELMKKKANYEGAIEPKFVNALKK
jgi:NitT/TauT family transport system substrate-binding protein